MKKILALLLAAGLLAGCGVKVEKHTTSGVIREIQQGGKVVVIDAAAFNDGYMEAMTMPYNTVDPAQVKDFKAGDKVKFTVTKQEENYPITEIEKIP